jgi:hypothetical protein
MISLNARCKVIRKCTRLILHAQSVTVGGYGYGFSYDPVWRPLPETTHEPKLVPRLPLIDYQIRSCFQMVNITRQSIITIFHVSSKWLSLLQLH